MDDELIKSLDDRIQECMDAELPVDLLNRRQSMKPAFVSIIHKDVRTQDLLISNKGSEFGGDELRGVVCDVFIGDTKGLGRGSVGIEDVPDFEIDKEGVRVCIKEELDTALKNAANDYFVRKGKSILSAEPNIFLNLSKEPVVQSIEEVPNRYASALSERKKQKLNTLSKTLSKIVRENEAIKKIQIEMTSSDSIRRYANSEGTKIRDHTFVGRCRLYLTVRTEDSRIIEHIEDLFHTKDIDKIRNFDYFLNKKVIDAELAHAKELAKTLPLGTGECPVVMDASAFATFTHELLVHLLSGQHIYLKESGIFEGKLGKIIMPTFLSIIDDPTYRRGFGHYIHDEEGVKSKRTVLVEKGVLKNYLLDRVSASELKCSSNGHARSGWVVNEDEDGEEIIGIPEPRASNLFIEASRHMSEQRLMKSMIDYCKKYNYDFGLLIKGGGLANVDVRTGDFEFKPTHLYKVYLDGKTELTSGAYFSGNPLYILDQIALCGDKYSTSSGICGSDSGDVPDWGKAPSAFIKKIAYKNDSGERLTKKILSKLD